MKMEKQSIVTSKWLRAAIFFVVIYFSQFYPYFHLHHHHENNGIEYEFSSHPVDIDITPLSQHHHHHHDDPDDQDTGKHQHSYDKHIDWHLIRSQSPRIHSFDSFVTTIESLNLPTLNNSLLFQLVEQNIQKTITSRNASLVRGPPCFS